MKIEEWIFDIDGTLFNTNEKDYAGAEPIEAMINMVNALHEAGHFIHIVTARGTSSGEDYTELTLGQLEKFGVHYDKLTFGIIVSDKVKSPQEFLEEI